MHQESPIEQLRFSEIWCFGDLVAIFKSSQTPLLPILNNYLNNREAIPGKWVLKTLNEQGKTIVIATHDYPLIRRFPARIITVDEQKIFETVITRKENKG